MTKKQDQGVIFKKTEQEPAGAVDTTDLDVGRTLSTGVGLKEGEVQAIDALAAHIGVTRNALMRFAVRWFLIQYRTGNIDLAQFVEEPPPTKKTLRLPGR